MGIGLRGEKVDTTTNNADLQESGSPRGKPQAKMTKRANRIGEGFVSFLVGGGAGRQPQVVAFSRLSHFNRILATIGRS